MSGPGDVDGEVSGDEAAWRDLVARFESSPSQATETAPWPAREDLPAEQQATAADQSPGAGSPAAGSPAAGSPAAGSPAAGSPAAGPPAAAGPADIPAVGGHVPLDGTRIIRFAGDPRAYAPREEEEERYKPEPLPPPARMDAVAKGAWVALIGGPGYLLLGTLLQWTISGTEALAAIAAFIAGFVILVVKMGDRAPRDENDDGAVL
jgi:hypothetical protein